MKKTIATLLSVVLLFSTMGMTVAAEEETVAPVYYPNGTVILNEDMVKENLDAVKIKYQETSSTNSATVTWNEETDRLRFTGDEEKNIMLELTDYPAGLDYYTISADIYLLENNFGNNVLIQMGSRNPNMSWGHGNLIQVYIYNDGNKSKVQMVDKGTADKTVGPPIKLDHIELNEKINLKIVIGEKIANYYINDTFVYAMKVEKMQYAYGCPFFAMRSKCILEIDNFMVWSGVGEPDATKTIHNTDPVAACDIPEEKPIEPSTQVSTDSITETPVEPETDTPPEPEESVPAASTTTGITADDMAKENGTQYVIVGSLTLLIIAAVVLLIVVKKRKH